MNNLTSLNLGFNKKINDDSIRNLSNLISLNLMANYKITDDGIRKLTNLTSINLSLNISITDYGIRDLIPNALMKPFDTADSTPDSEAFFILDFSTLENSQMTGMRIEPLAKTGLFERRVLSMTSGFKPLATENQGVIHAIDPALAMTA